MKKGDIILTVSLTVVSVVLFAVFFIIVGKAETVVISKDNKVLYELPLNEENEIDLGSNTVVIKNSEVYVEKADCKNQVCVNHKPISNKNQTIACLPNKVLIEIK